MKAADVLKRDNLLIGFIKEHRGRENPASAKDIVRYMWDSGYIMSETSVNPTLRKLMYERNLPICFISKRGYYWAACQSDILYVIEDIQKRIDGLQAHMDHLKRFIIK